MIDTQEVEARLEAEVATLANRVENAAAWTQLMKSGNLPRGGCAAYVLPQGIQGRRPDAATGMFIQGIRDVVAVVLVVHAVDRAGERALAELKPLINQVILAVAGWTPDEDTVGVFELLRGGLINAGNGVVAWQLEFAIDDQLRITS